MTALPPFIEILNVAAFVYDWIARAHGADVEGMPVAMLAQRHWSEARDLQLAAGAEIPRFDGTTLPDDLADWQSGSSMVALVGTIEREILRLGEIVYWSDAADAAKAVTERVLEASQAMVDRTPVGSDAHEESFTLLSKTPAVPDAGGSDRDGDRDDGPRGPTDPTEAEAEVDGYPVWYATNRRPVDVEDPSAGFTNERSVDGVRHGRCVVHVPESHRMGSLGSNVLTRVVRGSDDRLRIHDIEAFSEGAFWRELDGRLLGPEEADRTAVVFIHGYNVSFQDAALRSAQLGTDLGVRGIMTFFSWPSKGVLKGYFADGDSLEASTHDITEFLVGVATLPAVERVHVIAHSMGNRGSLRAVARIAADAGRLSGRRFAQFVLAAADVDVDVFRRDAGAYTALGDRTTLYVSAKDKALATSAMISDYARAGYAPPVSIVDGIDTVDVGQIDLDRLGHGYVGNSRGVLGDMHELFMHGAHPNDRFGLVERSDDVGRPYWTFRP